MRTAEHMEHRNLERKWRPSFSLGPHLTEGRSNDERTEIFSVFFACLVAAIYFTDETVDGSWS
jgi:hypothetical protein